MGVLDEGKTRHDIGCPNGSDNIEFDLIIILMQISIMDDMQYRLHCIQNILITLKSEIVI